MYRLFIVIKAGKGEYFTFRTLGKISMNFRELTFHITSLYQFISS